MMQLYFEFLGDWAVALIDFYRAHQYILNFIVLAYGLLLAVAHANVRTVEAALRTETGEDDMLKVREAIEQRPLSQERISAIRRSLRIPILASPWHFSFYRFSLENALRVLEKKYSRSRQQ